MANQETGKRRKNSFKAKNKSKQPEWMETLLDLGKSLPIPGKSSGQDSDERQMSKLKRQELLQILVSQSKEIDRLKQELKETREKLEDRELKIASSGSLAEASLQIFDVVNSVQKAADLYLENLKLRAEGRVPETDDPEDETELEAEAKDKPSAIAASFEEPADSYEPEDRLENSEGITGEEESHGAE